ncbi:MAG: T9SS C-terminal target domain-containing protein [Candidatus Zixiibacteriota bacterium]|nr:MAG: T9SS C-terminal target domain-containing protein [candidate division Zixibacteria bacterium]
MKQFLIPGWLALALLGMALGAGAQPPDTLWTRAIGGNSNDIGYSVQQTMDGGFIITGQTSSYGAGFDDIYLVKTDANGDSLWTRYFGGYHDDEGYSVQQTSDEGYVIAGITRSFGAGFEDIYLVKTNAAGNLVWQRTFGGPWSDGGYSVQETSDGGYIITGSTCSFGAGSYDVYVIKTDSMGEVAWTRTYGGSGSELGLNVQQTTDSGYIIAGFTESFGAGAYDVYLIKTDSLGDTVWTRTCGGGGDDVGRSVQQTPDGGYIVTGRTAANGVGCYDVYLIKTGALGDTIWTRTCGGSDWDEGYSIRLTSDSGFVIAGYSHSFDEGNRNVYLIKTDVVGNPIWQCTFGGSNWDEGRSVQQTSDEGYIVAGYTNSYGAGNSDVYIIKTDAEGTPVVPGEEPVSLPLDFALREPHPNPFNPSTVARFEMRAASHVSLQVYDTAGRMVKELVNGWKAAGVHTVTFDGSNLPSGIYLARLEAGNFTQTQKLVLLK